ncbi:MAG: translocation/assembly module TamB domain-containing protein [Bacteroides sp.]|nr:translocation/assembly module TamB domain-containing protein [Bacteroides sp.]
MKSKWLKKTGKITGYTLGGVVLFLVFLGGMLHTSPVQGFLAQKASGFASGFMDCEVKVGKLDFNLFKRSATLRNVEVFDYRHNRTVFVAEAMASLKNYDFKNLTLASIALYDPEIHIARYEGDTVSDFKRVIQKIAALPKKDTALRKPFRIEKGRVFNGTFTYEAQDAKHSPEGIIDYKHVGLSKVYAEASDFYSRCGIVLVKVQHVECNEKTGFRVDDFSTSLYLNKGELHFTDAHVKTPQSTVHLDYHLTAANWQLYKDFIHNVRMESDLRPSEVTLSDLGYFARIFAGMSQRIKAEGRVSGTVDNLDLKGLRLHTGRHSFLNADFTLAGIPRLKEGRLELQLDGLRLNTEDFKGMTLPNGKPFVLPEALQSLHWAKAKGFFSGGQRQFAVDLELCTDIGDIVITNAARDTADGMDIMAGNVQARNIRLDKLLNNDSLFGKVAVDADFRLSKQEEEALFCHAKGRVFDLEIDNKVLKEMPFHIDWQRDFLRADVECSDPNFDFDLLGKWQKKNDTSWLNCNLDMRNIDLRPLRLLGDTGEFTVKTHVVLDNIDCRGESVQGKLRIDGTEIRRLSHTYLLNNLQAEVLTKDSLERTLWLRSGLMDADLNGQWSFADLKYSFLNTVQACLPHLGNHLMRNVDLENKEVSAQDFDLRVRVNNADSLMSILYPPLSLPLGMKLNLRYASEVNRGRMQMAVPYVQMGSLAYLDGYFDLAVNGRAVRLETTADRFYLNDSVSMNRFALKVDKSDTNTVAYNLSWGNDGITRQSTNGRFAGLFHFLPEGGMRLELQDFRLQTKNTEWKSYSDGYVLFAPQRLEVYHVGMFSMQSNDGVSVEGSVSRDPASTLKVQFSDFDLSYLEFFLRKVPMKIETRVDGIAEMRDFYGDLIFNARLMMKDLTINDKLYGRGNVEASFSKNDVVQASCNILQDDKKTLLFLDGRYYPKRNGEIDFKGFARDCPVNFLDRILSSVAKDLSGEASGNLRLGGTLRSPELFADLTCKDFGLTVSMLRTRYVFKQVPIKLTSSRIDFATAPFVDEVFNTEGTFGGHITHRNFKDIRLDLGVGFNNLVALRTTRESNLPFWGTVFATGRLDIKGPVEDIVLQLNARTDENSDISFDFSNPTGGDGANFITFKAPVAFAVDSGRMTLEQYYARNRAAFQRKGKLTLDFNLEVTPDLAVSVRLRNSAMDGLLTATGKGSLRLYMDDNDPKLFGTYTVSGGGFDFSMVNLLNKRFKIKEGGTVSWLGNAGEPRVDVRAGYQTKASLYPVLSAFDPDESRYKQKVNVESIIALSGNLLNPDISFDIDLLNANDDTKDKFWALVRKNNEDEMLQQTFSLLMFNSFMAVESGSSTSVGSSALASSSEMLFSQFNNFLSRLSNDFNVGINYKPGSTTSNSEFQVMMSGQLFNDRLVINGNVGVSDNMAGTSSSATTVVGDVDIEWKFTEELRLRGFNHSNDEDLTKPVNSYTQGVSIVFQRDFDNLNEFLHGTTPRLTKAERKAERQKNREIRQKKRLEK